MSVRKPGEEANAPSPSSTLVHRRGPLDWVILGGGVLASVVIVASLGIILYAVAMRYFVGRPIQWSDELTGYLVVAMFMFGAGATLLRGDHIGIDLLTSAAGPRLSRGLSILSSAAVLGFALIFGWSAWHTVAFSRDFGTYSTGAMQIEIWKAQAPMLAGALLLGLAAAVNLVRALRTRSPALPASDCDAARRAGE